MKRLPIIILFLHIILGFSSNRTVDEDFHGSYSACNNSCERIRLVICPHYKVSATFSSTEFVGHFSDDIEGEYEVLDGNTALIKWTKINKDNTKYNKVPAEHDTIILVNPNKTVIFKRHGTIGEGIKLTDETNPFLELCKLTDETNPFLELGYRLFILALCVAPFYFVGRYFYKRMDKEDE